MFIPFCGPVRHPGLQSPAPPPQYSFRAVTPVGSPSYMDCGQITPRCNTAADGRPFRSVAAAHSSLLASWSSNASPISPWKHPSPNMEQKFPLTSLFGFQSMFLCVLANRTVTSNNNNTVSPPLKRLHFFTFVPELELDRWITYAKGLAQGLTSCLREQTEVTQRLVWTLNAWFKMERKQQESSSLLTYAAPPEGLFAFLSFFLGFIYVLFIYLLTRLFICGFHLSSVKEALQPSLLVPQMQPVFQWTRLPWHLVAMLRIGPSR